MAVASLVRTALPRSRALLLGSLLVSPSITRCDGDDIFPRDKDGNVDWSKAAGHVGDGSFWDALATKTGSQVQSAIDSGIPTQLSYGFISGYCSGYALRRVGKVAATVFGLGFMTLQTLAYNGYIRVDHVKIKKDLEDYLDLNEDGKVDKDDGALMYAKVVKVLEFNLPAGSGFAAGFVGGIRAA